MRGLAEAWLTTEHSETRRSSTSPCDQNWACEKTGSLPRYAVDHFELAFGDWFGRRLVRGTTVSGSHGSIAMSTANRA